MDHTNRVCVRLAQLGTLPRGLEDMPCLKTFTCDGNPFFGADIERSQVRPSFEVGLASIFQSLKRADILQDLMEMYPDTDGKVSSPEEHLPMSPKGVHRAPARACALNWGEALCRCGCGSCGSSKRKQKTSGGTQRHSRRRRRRRTTRSSSRWCGAHRPCAHCAPPPRCLKCVAVGCVAAQSEEEQLDAAMHQQMALLAEAQAAQVGLPSPAGAASSIEMLSPRRVLHLVARGCV